jgi:hypothetical protein
MPSLQLTVLMELSSGQPIRMGHVQLSMPPRTRQVYFRLHAHRRPDAYLRLRLLLVERKTLQEACP